MGEVLKSSLGRENSMCQGPGGGKNSVHLKNSEKAGSAVGK